MAESKITMMEMDQIIPFTYDRECFTALAKGRMAEVCRYFEPLRLSAGYVRRSSQLQVPGKGILSGEQEPHVGTVACYKLKENCRQAMGLYSGSKKGCCYVKVGGDLIPLRIGNVQLFAFSSGQGFLVIPVDYVGEETLSWEKMLDTRHLLCQLKRRTPLLWQAKGEEKPVKISLLKLLDQVLEALSVLAPRVTREDRNQSLSTACVITDHFPETISLQGQEVSAMHAADLLAGAHKSSSGMLEEIHETHWKWMKYIHWAVSDRSICAICDLKTGAACGESTPRFLQQTFRFSVRRNYLILYLYYLQMRRTVNRLEEEIFRLRNEARPKVSLELIRDLNRLNEKFPELVNADGENIDRFFRESLVDGRWQLRERICRLKQEHTPWLKEHSRYSVFISYRRAGGFYAAQLIHTILEQYGKRTFLDKDSLKGEEYDKRLRETIGECDCVISVLNPGSLDSCMDPKDWVRQELVWAKDHGKKIIPVLMDGFLFPDELPEDMERIRHIDGVIMNPDTFRGAIRTILERIEDANRDENDA